MMKLHRILLVEDDPDIQAVARLALEALGGYTVEVCNNGVEALQRAPAFAPDLVVLDVMMPEMDGPSTLKALRRETDLTEVPVVFMTARAQQHEIEAYKALGAADVITKPFDPIHLAKNLETIWHRCHGQ
ncbi:MAG: response regulator [Rhodothermaceae bacterium]|nr:MAG: response regulator [Bacteroidota bacterium]GIV61683.1 MAG: response regulator [Rhodothermaceae bacterium]